MQRIINLFLILSFAVMLSGCVGIIGPGRGISLLVSIIGVFIVVFGIRGLASNSHCDTVNKRISKFSESVEEHKIEENKDAD